MALTLEQILAPMTLAECQQFMIDVLTSVGFTGAASWQSGSFARTLGVEVPARLMANVRAIVVTYGNGGYNDLAVGDWLTLLSKSQFDNDRFQAVATQGVVELSSGTENYSLGPGELLVEDSITHQTFRNIAAFTLPSHATSFSVPVEAEVAGSDGNVPTGTITVVVTTLAGVSVNNPGVAGEWITRAGANPEEDPQLKQRNRTKWATRAYATPAAGYENYAREADPAVKRVFVDDQNPMGPGSVRIYIASEDGGSLPDTEQAVEDYIEGITDGYVRRPLCSELDCVSAVERPVAVDCTLYAAPGYTSVQAEVELAIEDYFSSIPIGGTKTTTTTGYVQISGLYAAVMVVPGVVNVNFSLDGLGPVDLELAPNEVAVCATTVVPLVV